MEKNKENKRQMENMWLTHRFSLFCLASNKENYNGTQSLRSQGLKDEIQGESHHIHTQNK